MVCNILQFDGIEANALFNDGVACSVSCSRLYSSPGNGSSYSSSSHNVVKGEEQGSM